MELFFLFLLIVLMATALGSGYPVAFALPGASILTIILAAICGYLFAGSVDAYFAQGGPGQWLSAGVTNLRGVYWEPERDTLIAIPLFIFMGIMLQRSKIAEDLLITMAQLFGPIPGGLGISVVFVGALLAATTGILGATVVAMGLISLPAMLRNNYSAPLATGTIAASGTLGQIIPPSIVLIILADQLSSSADQAGTARKALFRESTGELSMPSLFDVGSTSAGEMFLGAFIPGLVLVGLYMLFILVVAWIKPSMAPPVPYEGKYDRQFMFNVFMTLIPPLALIFLVLGSIISGIATVNQAGAIGAGGALIMAGYRLTEGQKNAYYPAILAVASLFLIGFVLANFNTGIKSITTTADAIGVTLAGAGVIGLLAALGWSGWRAVKIDETLHGVMIETAKTTTLVFIILLGAAILTAAFRAFGGEHLVREFLNSLPGGFWSKFVVVMGVIFLLGFFLDFIEIAVVVVPIVAPILLADPSANVTAVWLGVMIGLNIQTSFLTPPFGFALFYLRGVAPPVVKTIQMYKGVIPFISLQLVALVIVGLTPQLVNYLPNRVSLLSETSPPPRNPRLSYCVDNYIGDQFAENSDEIRKRAEIVRTLDFSTLPDKLGKSAQDSVDETLKAMEIFAAAEKAAGDIEAASAGYRPMHGQVRDIESDMRALAGRIEILEIDIDRLRDPSEQAAREKLEDRVANLVAQRDALKATIPAEWAGTFKAFSDLRKAESTARSKFNQAAGKAYGPIAEVLAILRSAEDLGALADKLTETNGKIGQTEPEEMDSALRDLSDQIGDVAGTREIKSAISVVRKALKAKTPDKDEALAEMAKASELLETQLVWRKKASSELLQPLAAYEELLRTTVGLREQSKLTREQALYVAGCTSDHRDISLSF